MLRPAPAVDVIPLLAEERAELVGLLRDLDDEAAARVTAATPWSVKDVAAHLLGNDLSALARLRDGFDDPTLEAPPSEWGPFVEWLELRNQRWVDAAGFMSAGVIADALAETGRLTADFFSTLAPGEPGEVVSWASPDPAPNWLCIGREFTERWIHQQQIRDALERPGLNGPSFVTPVLAVLVRGVPRAYAGSAPPVGTTVEISVAGRGGGAWAVRRAAHEWDLLEGREREVDARVTLDQETMWRFLSRNTDPAAAKAAADLDGPAELTDPFFEAVSVIVRT
jgi:uncharacterized protein (TIGR03083 family)